MAIESEDMTRLLLADTRVRFFPRCNEYTVLHDLATSGNIAVAKLILDDERVRGLALLKEVRV
jgi:hypothetical protein